MGNTRQFDAASIVSLCPAGSRATADSTGGGVCADARPACCLLSSRAAAWARCGCELTVEPHFITQPFDKGTDRAAGRDVPSEDDIEAAELRHPVDAQGRNQLSFAQVTHQMRPLADRDTNAIDGRLDHLIVVRETHGP